MKRIKSVIALMLIVCMVLTEPGILQITAKAQQPERNAEVTIIDVTDYGADPGGYYDSALAVQAAIEKAAELDGEPTIINFPKGEYHIYPDYSEKRDLYVSNTSGTNQAVKKKTIGILLEDMENVTIEGNGSLFVFHGKMTTLSTIRCRNIKFQNFAFDFQVPTVVDITVEEVGDGYAVAYVPECFEYEIDDTSITWLSDVSPYTGKRYWTAKNSMNYTQRYDLTTGETWRGNTGYNPLFSGATSIEDMGNHRLKFNYGVRPSELAEGICYQMRNTLRDTPGTFLWESSGITLKNIDAHFLHGFGMVGQFSENITYDGVRFKTPANSGRTTAGYADFVQMSGCKGLIDIKNCLFSNPHDDPINIHGTFLQVVEKYSSRKFKVRYMHNETAGFPNFYVGDEVEFMTKGNMVPVENSVATVTEVEGPSEASLTDIIITLDRDVPDEIGVNTHVVENISYTPSVSITNNVFQATPTRGILVTTRKPVVIEDNYFDSMNMSAIYISNDASGWYESGPTTDVTIRGNVFDKCSDKVIFFEPTGTPNVDRPVHSNAVIENNIFRMENGRVLDAKSVGNLQFKNNQIYRYEPGVSLKAKSRTLLMDVGDESVLNIEAEGNSLHTGLFHFNACNQVSLSGNLYDGGMNQRADLEGGMLATSQYIIIDSSEDVTIGQDNKKDPVGTLSYRSSNEDVATVTSDGIVQAVSKGTAEIQAYAVLAGRAFESETITVYVGDNEEIVKPEKVNVTSFGDTLTEIGQTMQFTAEVLPENAEVKDVAWSVLDPFTGKESELASIDQNGILSARMSGAVLVQAETANHITGAKLIVIRAQNDAELGNNWSIVREDANGWGFLQDSDGVRITAQGGSLWATGNGVKNIITTGYAGSLDKLTATVKVSGKTAVNYEECGIIFYKDDDNYTAVQRKHGTGNPVIAVVNEVRGAANEDGSIPDVDSEYIYFRLVKEGERLTGSYSLDGSNWTEIRSVDNAGLGDTYRIGVIAGGGNGSNAFTFTNLTIEDGQYGFKIVNKAPEAMGISYNLNGAQSAAVGVGMTAEYDYRDMEGDAEGASVVLWMTCGEEDGDYQIASEVAGSQITIPESFAGKYVKAAVVPIDAKGKWGAICYGPSLYVEGSAGKKRAGARQGEEKSANAFLKEAVLTGVNFAEFTPERKYYIATAQPELEKTNISLKAQDADAVIKLTVNGHVIEEAAKGGISLTDVALIANHNIIEAKVTAPDGVDIGYYRFIIMRRGFNNANLSSVKVDGAQIVGFDSGVTEYMVEVEHAKTVTVEVQQEHPSAETAIIGAGLVGRDGSQEVVLNPGMNQVVVSVKPDTNGPAKNYILNFRVADENNNKLLKMQFSSNISMNETFEDERLEYHGIVGSGEGTLVLEAQDLGARIRVESNGIVAESEDHTLTAPLKFYDGENIVKITVIGASGRERVYTATIDASAYTYANDQNWNTATTGWGELRIDASVENDAISLVGEDGEIVVHEKGIGAHADSTITFNLEGKGYERFQSYVGVDASQAGRGTVRFTVLLDGEEVFNSGVMTSSSVQKRVDILLGDAKVLSLVADKVENNANDHADWADAKFVSSLEKREVCTCEISNLVFEVPEIELNEAGEGSVRLNASAELLGDCQIESHRGAQVVYSYHIISDTTGTAQITDGNLLKVGKAGKIRIEVIAKAEQTETAVASKEAEVTVTEKEPEPEPVRVTGLTVSPDETTVEAGGIVALIASVQPENAENKNVTWSSANPEIAVVENGVVTGVKAGTTEITVTTEDGAFEAVCKLTVTKTDVPAPILKPGKAEGVKSSKLKKKSILLTWNAVAGAESYEIYRYDYSTKKWDVVQVGKATRYTDTKRTAGSKYKYQVLAKNSAGRGEKSDAVVTATKPVKPKLKLKQLKSGKVKLSWKRIKASKIVVYMRTGKKGFKRVSTRPGKAVNYQSKKLKKGTYRFKVRGYVKVNAKKKVYGAYSTVQKVTIR